jgi:hypothetical protein
VFFLRQRLAEENVSSYDISAQYESLQQEQSKKQKRVRAEAGAR